MAVRSLGVVRETAMYQVLPATVSAQVINTILRSMKKRGSTWTWECERRVEEAMTICAVVLR